MFEKILLIPGPRGAEEPVFRRAESPAGSLRAEIEVFEPVYEPLLEGYYGNREIYEPPRRRLVAERLEAAPDLADELPCSRPPTPSGSTPLESIRTTT